MYVTAPLGLQFPANIGKDGQSFKTDMEQKAVV